MKGLLKSRQKVYACMTEGVRYRTVSAACSAGNKTAHLQKSQVIARFSKKACNLLYLEDDVQKNARKDFENIFWYNDLEKKGMIHGQKNR